MFKLNTRLFVTIAFTVITFLAVFNYYPFVNHLSTINLTEWTQFNVKRINHTKKLRNITCVSRICFLVEQRLVGQSENNFKFYTSSELELTKSFALNKYNYCGENYGIKTQLITIVYSTNSRFYHRNAIRNTWGNELKAKGVNVLFLTAKPISQTIQKKIEEEDSKFHDLIQSPFIDDYYNETLKAMAMLNTLYNNCRNVKFVLKTDEDVLINVNRVFSLMNNYTNTSKAIFGTIFRGTPVLRDVSRKWYVPSFVFKPNIYPDYPSGPIVMFTGDSIEALLSKFYDLSPFYIDDSYVGIVAEKVGVSQIEVNAIGSIFDILLHNTRNKPIGYHLLYGQQILSMWSLLNQSVIN